MENLITRSLNRLLGKTRPNGSNVISNQEFVEFSYQTILGRSADTEGRQHYLTAIAEGQLTREDFVLELVQSEEFQTQQTTQSPEPAPPSENLVMTNQEFIEFCYQVILRKPADQKGKLNFVQQLESGSCTREAVLLQFAEVGESQSPTDSKKTDVMEDKEFVEFAYQIILGRKADAGGKANCLQALTSGQISREALLLQLVNSDEYQTAIAAREFVPTGHFFSAVPSLQERYEFLQTDFAQLARVASLPGIDLNVPGQLKLLAELQPYYDEFPFPEWKTDEFRYYFANPAYAYADGLMLYSMMRYCNPRKIIEVGSGFSSCAMLDTNQHFFNNAIELTFIEPYPDLLYSLIQDADRNSSSIYPVKLQEIDLNYFEALEANDILFIDSTHVSKLNSDVNRIFFEILPALKSGVIIHFHDVFWPFEYPQEWIREGRSWNELYTLRAFLQFNSCFEILFFYSYLYQTYNNLVQQAVPDFLRDAGSSIWLRKR